MEIRLVYRPGDPTSKLKYVKYLDKKIFYQDQPYEDYENAYWFLVYINKKPIAFAGISIHGDIGYLARCGVSKKYRGKRIQEYLIDARLKIAKLCKIKHVRTYTSLDNYASINSLLKFGFRIVEPTQELSNGKWLIFQKTLYGSKSMTKRLDQTLRWSVDMYHKK